MYMYVLVLESTYYQFIDSVISAVTLSQLIS